MEDLLELRRGRDDALLAGVCVALSRRFGVDLLLVRVAMVLLALSSGLGVVLYAWAWLVLPATDGAPGLAERWWPVAGEWSARTKLWLGAALVLLGTLVGSTVFPWGLGPAVVLVVAVLVARRAGDPASASPRDAGRTVPSSPPPRLTRRRGVARSSRPVRHRRAHRFAALGTGVAALVVLAVAAQGLLPRVWPGGGVTGRQQTVAFADAAQLPTQRQEVKASQVTYDLTDLPPAGGGRLELRATASAVTVLVPADATLRVDYRLAGSELTVHGSGGEVFQADGSSAASWPESPSPMARTAIGTQFVIDVDARVSTVVVRQRA